MPVRRLLFAKQLLRTKPLVHTTEAEMALVAIMADENSQAHWNPLDTTLFVRGATPYNSFGEGGVLHVWNYANARDGIIATIHTMEQANMAPWVDLLRKSGHRAEAICEGYSQVPWSSIGNTMPLQLVRQWRRNPFGYVRARRVIIPGPGHWPYTRRGVLIK